MKKVKSRKVSSGGNRKGVPKNVVPQARSRKLDSLADAMGTMAKSHVLASIQQAFQAHRSAAHNRGFSKCPLPCCSQIDALLRARVEAAQEELDTAHKLDQARKDFKNACPKASDDFIEALARSASSPSDDSDHPIHWLESPYDPARSYNEMYPGLEFHRRRHKNADPVISWAYYLWFHESNSEEDVLFKFMDAHPVEFECSGWVVSVLARKLLGPPHCNASENEARNLLREYWKRRKHPKDAVPTLPQRFVTEIAYQETKRLSTPAHWIHFRQAALWVAKQSESDSTLAAFQKGHTNACACIAEIDFPALKTATDTVRRWFVGEAQVANVLQEYVGILCGMPSRTIGLWRSKMQ